jgi:hypothetical protein
MPVTFEEMLDMHEASKQAPFTDAGDGCLAAALMHIKLFAKGAMHASEAHDPHDPTSGHHGHIPHM